MYDTYLPHFKALDLSFPVNFGSRIEAFRASYVATNVFQFLVQTLLALFVDNFEKKMPRNLDIFFS